MAGRRRKGRASVGLLFGANPFDELAVAVDEPDTVREALGRELSTGGPAALERWGPIQAVLERRPEERWWLALMSRCGGQPHADDHALRSAAQASAHPGVLGVPGESLRAHLRENLGQAEQRAAQLRELIDLPELPSDTVWAAGLMAYGQEEQD